MTTRSILLAIAIASGNTFATAIELPAVPQIDRVTFNWLLAPGAKVAMLSGAEIARTTELPPVDPHDERGTESTAWHSESDYYARFGAPAYLGLGYNLRFLADTAAPTPTQSACLHDQQLVINSTNLNPDMQVVAHHHFPQSLQEETVFYDLRDPVLLDNQAGAVAHEALLATTAPVTIALDQQGEAGVIGSHQGLLPFAYLGPDQVCHLTQQATLEQQVEDLAQTQVTMLNLRGPARNATDQAALDARAAYILLGDGNRTLHDLAEVFRALEATRIVCGPNTVLSSLKTCSF